MNAPSELYTNDGKQRPALDGPATPTRAWVTGAGGLIGSYLCREATFALPGSSVKGITREKLELTHFTELDDAFAHDCPELVIHCAAVSRSPVCQAQPTVARQINVEVTRHLRDLTDKALLVFLSTDLVFDG